jgi:hypothetical protein
MPEDADRPDRDQPDDTGAAEPQEQASPEPTPPTSPTAAEQEQAVPAPRDADRPVEAEPASPSAGLGGESPKRVIHRRTSRYSTSKTTETDETIKETITEDITPPAYQGPVTGPPPVG